MCWPWTWRQSADTSHTVWWANAKLGHQHVHTGRTSTQCGVSNAERGEGMLQLAGGRRDPLRWKTGKVWISEIGSPANTWSWTGRRRVVSFVRSDSAFLAWRFGVDSNRSFQPGMWLVLCQRNIMGRCRGGGNTKQHCRPRDDDGRHQAWG